MANSKLKGLKFTSPLTQNVEVSPKVLVLDADRNVQEHDFPSGGGCLTANCVRAMPELDPEEALASDLPEYTPYRTSKGEIRYKLPAGTQPEEGAFDDTFDNTFN